MHMKTPRLSVAIASGLVAGVALCTALSTALSAASPASDAALTTLLNAPTSADAVKAADAAAKAGATFDEAFAALKKGRAYKADVPTGIVKSSYKQGDLEFFYQLDIPPTYDASKRYQLRVQLHGGVGRPDPAPRSSGIGALAGAVGVGHVADMQDDIGRRHFLQRRPEGFHQLGRQVRDEAHRVAEDGGAAAGQADGAHGRVQRGEELVLRIDAGAGQRVEQRGLAGVGVADQGDDRIRHLLAGFAMKAAGAFDGFEVAFDARHALLNKAPVRFDLRFARSTQKAEAPALTFKMGP